MIELIVAHRNFANAPKNDGEIVNGKINVIDETLKARIKSHLLFAGIIRSSPFSPR